MSHQQQQQPALKPGDVFPASDDPIASAERERTLAREDEEEDRLFVEETKLPGGRRLVTSSAKGQAMSQFAVPAPAPAEGADLWGEDKVTIGEALEAAAAGASADKEVSRSDAAAVQAAETRATRQGRATAGGVAAAMQKAAEANANARTTGNKEGEVKISDVLSDATARLAEDKVVTREDAERVLAAKKRNSGEGPVAAAMEAASRMNRGGVA